MGRMWLKASTIINDLIAPKDNIFINSSLDWFDLIYKRKVENHNDTTVSTINNSIVSNQLYKANRNKITRGIVKEKRVEG